MHAQGAYAPEKYGVLAIAHHRHAVQDEATQPSAAYSWRDASVAPFANSAVAKTAWSVLSRVIAPVDEGANKTQECNTPYEP